MSHSLHSTMRRRRAFSLVELMVSTAILTLAGLVVYHIMTISLHLQSKNLSINTNVHRGRSSYQIMSAALRESVSIPRLIDATRANVTGNGSAAGFSLQRRVGGPFLVHNNATANSPNISIRTGDFTPDAGDWLVIPAFNLEKRIASVMAVNGTPTVRNLQLDENLGETITITNPPFDDLKVVAYITRRSQYVVQNGELRFYPSDAAAAFQTVATNVTTPAPFRVPSGIASNRQILITLSCEEAGLSTLRGLFRRDGLTLNTRAAARFQLTEGR